MLPEISQKNYQSAEVFFHIPLRRRTMSLSFVKIRPCCFRESKNHKKCDNWFPVAYTYSYICDYDMCFFVFLLMDNKLTKPEKITQKFVGFIFRKRSSGIHHKKCKLRAVIPKKRPKFEGLKKEKKTFQRSKFANPGLKYECFIRFFAPKWIYGNIFNLSKIILLVVHVVPVMKKNHSHIVLPCLIGYRIGWQTKRMLRDNILETCSNAKISTIKTKNMRVMVETSRNRGVRSTWLRISTSRWLEHK